MRLNRTAWGTAAALALAAAAAPAMAQDFCGGASAGGQWIGGTEAASDVATAGSHMEQMALVLMGNEYVALFSVSAPTEVRLEAQGRGAGDPVIDLRDEGGAILLSDDDSGGNSASRAETTLQPGRYCLSVRSYDGSPMTGFVRVGRTEHEALTAGAEAPMPEPMPGPEAGGICDPATVTNRLGEGQPLDALLGAGGATATASAAQSPFWAFTLAAPAAISITAESDAADPVITLYDAWGGWLAENDDWEGLNSRIDMTYPLEAGDYCVAVSALADSNAPITLTVSAYDAAAAAAGSYDRGEAAPPLDGSWPVTALGPLGNRLRSDVQTTQATSWFSFDVPAAGLVLVEAVTAGQGDPTLVLFDDFGRQVAFNDDSGGTLDSLLTARVMPGTYLVGVRQLSGDRPVLTRLLFERYVPAQP